MEIYESVQIVFWYNSIMIRYFDIDNVLSQECELLSYKASFLYQYSIIFLKTESTTRYRTCTLILSKVGKNHLAKEKVGELQYFTL